jgi:hypothetical protein
MATANLLQTSVSGGTQNALSLQGDGVFFPKASTTSRLALTLGTTDKGFIVYDTTDNNIYFWNGTAWESVPSSGDAGANGSVQYNDNGIVSGATNFVWDKVNSRVGIGTATPTVPLEVAGAATITGNVVVKSGNALILNRTDNLISTQLFDSGSNGFVIDNLNVNGVQIRLNSVTSLTLNPTANLVLKGGTVAANGVGVTFPATQVASSDANCLDDYEEGTWVPSVGGTATYAVQRGNYVKVGRLVTVSFDMEILLIGTGDVSGITSLPFVVGNAGGVVNFPGYGAPGFTNLLAINTYSMTFYAAANTTIIYNITKTALSGSSNVNSAIYGNASRVQGSITYMVT